MKPEPVILLTGACGQIGTELLKALRERYGREAVIATDQYYPGDVPAETGTYFRLDVLDRYELEHLVCSLGVTQIYHLAAILSATGEKAPMMAWDLNMQSLLNVLEVARTEKLDKVFWPSSIAVFGKHLPQGPCPQHTVTQPNTAYGISKLAGEQWCRYYFETYGLDVRSLRFPGLVSHSAKAGGGTTDYAVEIFHEAVKHNRYTCFLKEDTKLPMLYMADAVRAVIQLMEVPPKRIGVRTSYNLSGMSFTPAELAEAIRAELQEFEMAYAPDVRQQIADSWPRLIDDMAAHYEWGWEPTYDLKAMCTDMLEHLKEQVHD